MLKPGSHNDLERCGFLWILPIFALSVATPAFAGPQAHLETEGFAAAAPTSVFPTPTPLESAVKFWQDLFLQHPSHRIVIHDKDEMDVVWQVIDLPKKSDGGVDEKSAKNLMRSSADDIRARLKRLEVKAVAEDPVDQALLNSVSDDPTRLAGAWQRVRCQRGVADHFKSGYQRYLQWAPEIKRILKEEGVPTEISVLPFVESMFNPMARSAVGASGLWQLMPATARGLGLQVKRRGGTDERNDVLKATRAAARMLRQNYRSLGSWPLAITAYNHGPNGVARACKKVGSTDLAYLIDNYDRATWGFASKNFYAEFLAAMRIMSNSDSLPFSTAVTATAETPAIGIQ